MKRPRRSNRAAYVVGSIASEFRKVTAWIERTLGIDKMEDGKAKLLAQAAVAMGLIVVVVFVATRIL